MNKQVILVISILLIIIIIVCGNILLNNINQKDVKLHNFEYEQYLDKTIYGTDIATLINKAINDNKKNNIEQDEKGNFLDDEENSILIDLVMITDEGKQEKTTYNMETIEKVGITEFIQNFSLTTFKSSDVEYHQKTGKISKITFEQLESISY